MASTTRSAHLPALGTHEREEVGRELQSTLLELPLPPLKKRLHKPGPSSNKFNRNCGTRKPRLNKYRYSSPVLKQLWRKPNGLPRFFSRRN